eukprot:scaffold119541_cov102-Attheya_sp.AAC.1
MRYGVSSTHSPPAFTGYAILMMSVLGNYQAGRFYGGIALAMNSRCKTKVVEASTINGAYFGLAVDEPSPKLFESVDKRNLCLYAYLGEYEMGTVHALSIGDKYLKELACPLG